MYPEETSTPTLPTQDPHLPRSIAVWATIRRKVFVTSQDAQVEAASFTYAKITPLSGV